MPETFDVSSLKERYYIYVLFFYQDRGFYIGYTISLKNRLIDHAAGQVPATKDRIPFKLIHYEYFINRKDAKSREEYLKSGHGREQLKNFLKNTLNDSSKEEVPS